MNVAEEYGNIPSQAVDWPHCCDTVHLRLGVLKHLRDIRITCDAFSNKLEIWLTFLKFLSNIFSYFKWFAASGWLSIGFLVICESNLSVKYFELPSQEKMKTIHCEWLTEHTAAILEELRIDYCDAVSFRHALF